MGCATGAGLGKVKGRRFRMAIGDREAGKGCCDYRAFLTAMKKWCQDEAPDIACTGNEKETCFHAPPARVPDLRHTLAPFRETATPYNGIVPAQPLHRLPSALYQNPG